MPIAIRFLAPRLVRLQASAHQRLVYIWSKLAPSAKVFFVCFLPAAEGFIYGKKFDPRKLVRPRAGRVFLV